MHHYINFAYCEETTLANTCHEDDYRCLGLIVQVVLIVILPRIVAYVFQNLHIRFFWDHHTYCYQQYHVYVVS